MAGAALLWTTKSITICYTVSYMKEPHRKSFYPNKKQPVENNAAQLASLHKTARQLQRQIVPSSLQKTSFLVLQKRIVQKRLKSSDFSLFYTLLELTLTARQTKQVPFIFRWILHRNHSHSHSHKTGRNSHPYP